MNLSKENIRRVFWLFFAMSVLMIGYLLKFYMLDREAIINSSYNRRLGIMDKMVTRGDIQDRNGNLLAQNDIVSEGYLRKYPYAERFAHIVGYTDSGKDGIEDTYNFELQHPKNEISQRINNIISDEPIKGNNVILTVDADLQNYIYDKLGNNKAAAVAMDPKTGQILAMVSKPSFDPNKVGYEWNSIINRDDSPLLNRATQGLYPPGSVFKIITAALLNQEELNGTYQCLGFDDYEGSVIRCYNQTKHGEEDLSKAFSQSCNSYFAHMINSVPLANFRTLADKLYFNNTYENKQNLYNADDLSFRYSKSSFTLNMESSRFEAMQTAIGQGKTLVTPLHMALIGCAVANGGVVMKPYLTDHFVSGTGKSYGKIMPSMLAQFFSPKEAQMLTDLMIDVVNTGTGKNAALKTVQIAGKTGTAQNSSGDDHGWFVAFAPADNPKIVLSIIIENCGGSGVVLPLARDILNYALD